MFFQGANGLANPRDFVTPVAWFERVANIEFRLVFKYQGHLFESLQESFILEQSNILEY